MTPSITIAATFFNEVNAMPGFLEMASAFADELLLVDCGPADRPSTDGTLDILRKWGIEPLHWRIDPGFGAVRTQLLHTCKTPWAIICDIDERISVCCPILRCTGTDKYPETPNPKLSVRAEPIPYNHLKYVKDLMNRADREGKPSVRFARRHWFKPGYKHPTQNWEQVRDYQLRCMRTDKWIGFKTETRMHEHAFDSRTNKSPEYIADDNMFGPYFDHYHLWFKSMEPEQRKEDIAIYDAIHFGTQEETWKKLGYK